MLYDGGCLTLHMNSSDDDWHDKTLKSVRREYIMAERKMKKDLYKRRARKNLRAVLNEKSVYCSCCQKMLKWRSYHEFHVKTPMHIYNFIYS